MNVTRRDFLRYCIASAGALGLGEAEILDLQAAMAGDGAPTLVWLHGSGCQGDSISLLNRIASDAPQGRRTVDEVLTESVSLAYHTVLMSAAGQTAVAQAQRAKRQGDYVLVAEGGVPTAFEGRACQVWTFEGRETTYHEALREYASRAKAILAVGTCATYGGIPMAGGNPTGVIPVSQAIDRPVINIPGCPTHPDWIVWPIVQLILGMEIELDQYRRPIALYGENVHDNCPRNVDIAGNSYATTFGQDRKCLENLGCRGPQTQADCPSRKWNGGASWCVDSNGMCIACVEPDFPGGPFYL